MAKVKKPRSGSMQFWPRVRAKRIYPKIKAWAYLDENKPLAFIGYKAGMTHIGMIDNNKNSPTKGQQISCPVTVIECPPLKTASIKFYKNSHDGLKTISEIHSKNLNKELAKKINLPKKPKAKEPNSEEVDEVKITVYTQPKLTGIGKNKPELLEIGIGGKDTKSKIEYAKSLLDKEIKITDIFKEGQQVDVHAVTKGKGTQGPVKRFGIKIRQHKSEKTKRGPGTLGPWRGQAHIMFRVAHAGQTGYHTRTEYNKLLLKISNDPKEINPKGGFMHYGNVKNEYIMIKGSIPGPRKRAIELTEPIRSKQIKIQKPEINYISLTSKQ